MLNPYQRFEKGISPLLISCNRPLASSVSEGLAEVPGVGVAVVGVVVVVLVDDIGDVVDDDCDVVDDVIVEEVCDVKSDVEAVVEVLESVELAVDDDGLVED